MSVTPTKPEWRRLRILIVLTLVALTAQGWFGDTVNLFSSFPTGTVESSASGVLSAVLNAGPTLIIHSFIGIVILALSVAVLAFSLKSKPRSVQVPSILGLVMVVSALIGGVLFVLSGFTNNGVSAHRWEEASSVLTRST